MVCVTFYTLDVVNSGTLLNSFLYVILPSLTRKRIFGLALFLTFFCGAPIGPLFDAYGPRLLMVCGSVLLIASMFLLGLCTREWSYPMVYHANGS